MKQTKFYIDYLKYIYGALLAFIILLTSNLLFQAHIDLWLSLSLLCFAIAIPFLVLSLVMTYYKQHTPPNFDHDWSKKWDIYHWKVIYVTFPTSFLGITFVFMHSNIYIGTTFAVAFAISTYIHYKCVDTEK